MHVAAVRWISEMLRHPQFGLLAMLADGVPNMPDGLDVPMLAIYDETRSEDSWVAYGQYPESIRKKGPCVIVRATGATVTDDVKDGNGRMTCQVAIHMLAPTIVDGVPASVARMQAAFILRAAQRVILKSHPLEHVTRTNPVVFGATITPPRDGAFSSLPLYDPETLGNGVLLDALLVTVDVDDPWARGYDVDTPFTA